MVRLSPLIWTPKLAHVLSSASRIRESLFSTSSGTTTPASVKDCGPSSISSPPMEKDLRSLAHQDHHGRYPPAMGSGPAPVQSPLRFCDLSAKSLKGIRRLQQDASALSRNRLRGPITKSGRDGWSLVNILPGGQERDGQASRYCRGGLGVCWREWWAITRAFISDADEGAGVLPGPGL